jgi:energy-coupling factor transport system permease protein
VVRSRYRPDPWRAPEVIVMAAGVSAAVAMWWVAGHQVLTAYPDLTSWPSLTPAALVAAAVGAVAAVAAPEPRLALA